MGDEDDYEVIDYERMYQCESKVSLYRPVSTRVNYRFTG